LQFNSSLILSASKCLANKSSWWRFNNSSLTEKSFETYNDSLYSIISWLFNVQASTSLFHILVVSSAFNLTANSFSCCKILMSSTMNLLLKSYVISWIISTLTITHEMSCLQSTVSATELSCSQLRCNLYELMFQHLCFLKLLIWIEKFYFLRNVLHLDAFLALLKSWSLAAYFWHALLNTYLCFHWHCEQTSSRLR